jgi:hypothetical protein
MKLAKSFLHTALGGGVGLMAVGAFSISQSSPDPGGGLPAVLGFLFLVSGGLLTGVALVVALSLGVYGSLSDKAKRKVKLGLFVILPCAWIGWSYIQAYLFWRPSAVAERQRVEAERAQLEVDARKKHEETSESLIGIWQNVAEPNYVMVVGYAGTSYRTDGGEIQIYDSWSLCYRSDGSNADCRSQVAFADPSAAFQLDFRSNRGIAAYEILQLDDSRLVAEHLFDSGDKWAIQKDSATQSFRRVTDAVTLRNFRPRGRGEGEIARCDAMEGVMERRDCYDRVVMMHRAQPDAETKIIDGVTHRFFPEPVPALTSNAWVASRPNQGFGQVASLSEGDSVELIAVTDMEFQGSFWFQIRYRDGLGGYAVGNKICPKDVWVDGLLPPGRFQSCEKRD